jgi:hypothetical protein
MPAVDDLKALDRLDQVVLGAGVLGLIFSFFGFVGKSVSVFTYTESAWNGLGILAMLLLLVATVLAAARLFAPTVIPKMQVGVNVLTLALCGLGTLLLLIHGLAASKSGVHLGLRWGGIVTLVLFIAQAVAAFLLFKKSGEAMPDFKAMQANRAATAGAGTPPAAPPASTYPPATPAGDFSLDDSTPPSPTV